MSALPAVRPHQDAPAPATVHLFVSTTLEFWSTDQGAAFARDVQIDDTAFRRLDPEYYAWLRSRMVLAKNAVAARQLDAAAFGDLRARFNAVHEWAVKRFGEERLLAAVGIIRAADYRPPVAEDDRPHAPLPRAAKSAGDHVSPEVVAMVDAIGERATALGWSRERLYAIGKGPFDPQRGLICFLKPADQIGEVTAQSIEIIHPLPTDVRHRFYNPDVNQPWIIRVAEQKK